MQKQSDDDSTEPYNLQSDWSKLERDMKKVGLKNGLSDGRETNFQQSFDKGYEDGFKNGFILGYLKFQSEQKKKLQKFLELEKVKSANCIVCFNDVGKENVRDVREKQSELVNTIVKNIKADLNL